VTKADEIEAKMKACGQECMALEKRAGIFVEANRFSRRQTVKA
jgi:hypothetical protein